MTTQNMNTLTRRLLLQRAAQLCAMGVAGPLAINLAAVAQAAAFSATDYKALVCVFLYGGNDYANTVIPYDLTNYDLYSSIRGGGAGRTRGGIALGRDELSSTVLTPGGQMLTDGLQYALAPELKGLKLLFDAGKLAVQLNVGSLILPVTLAQYNGGNRNLYPLPPKLFSHDDQQSFWQSLGSSSTTGWGGRIGDLGLSNNDNASLTCISAAGNAVFVAGRNAVQYQISPSGAIKINALQNSPYGLDSVRDAMAKLITQASSQVLEDEFAAVTRRSISLEALVNTALMSSPANTAFAAVNPANELAAQLKIVARLIGARSALGVKRQVFFVSLNGFDSHDALMKNHALSMAQVNEAISAFYQATVDLGVSNNVTTFTASDFGRTLSANSDGSDHGWGSHHFIVGGAVKGGQFYGTAPHVSVNSDDQVGQGRLLPSTSVDQFSSTLAQWFGVSASELPGILPNIGNFGSTSLGFI